MIYKLTILNPDLTVATIYTDFISCIWTTQYFAAGEFEFVVEYSPENMNNLKCGNFIVKNNTDEIAVIEKVRYEYNPDEGGKIIASGRMAISLLDRRLIYNFQNYRPFIIGYCPINGNLEDNARQTVYEQAIQPMTAGGQIATARIITNLALGTDKGYTETSSGARISTHLNLYNAIASMLATKNLSHRIIYDGGQLKYEVTKGTDKSNSIVFSRALGNLLSFNYEKDRTDLKSYMYVGGEGEGLNQMVTSVTVNGGPTGLERREMYYAASSDRNGLSDANYSSVLQCEARTEAREQAEKNTVEAEIDLVNSGYEFGMDYNVGDIILIRDVIDFKPRITTVIESQSADGYTIDVEFNEDRPEEEQE